MTADWFRQTEWSDKHLAEFLARNKRSRGNASRAQHIRIQAVTLLETDKPLLVEAGLQLLVDHYFPQFSRELDASVAFGCAGQCCEALGRLDDAVGYYERALAHEIEMPNVQSGAAYSLAKLAVELGRRDLVSRALQGIDPQKASPFPWHSYIVTGARAFLAALEGDLPSACSCSGGVGQGRGFRQRAGVGPGRAWHRSRHRHAIP